MACTHVLRVADPDYTPYHVTIALQRGQVNGYTLPEIKEWITENGTGIWTVHKTHPYLEAFDRWHEDFCFSNETTAFAFKMMFG